MASMLSSRGFPALSSLSSRKSALEWKNPKNLTSPFGPLGGAHSGGNLKEVRNRMKSVKSIEKITKTMKMIANSRLKSAQLRMEKSRPFYESLTKILKVLPGVDVSKRNVIVPVTSDRGLCGAINSSIAKATRQLMNSRAAAHPNATFRLVNLGEKSTGIFVRDQGNKVAFSATDLGKKPFGFASASFIAERILAEEPFDSLTVIHNKFISTIAYTQETKDVPSSTQFYERTDRVLYDFDGCDDDQQILDFTELNVAATIYNSYAESVASELGARMSAMDSASRNAGDMLKLLNVFYNRRRQAAITTELTEIISGASAIQTE